MPGEDELRAVFPRAHARRRRGGIFREFIPSRARGNPINSPGDVPEDVILGEYRGNERDRGKNAGSRRYGQDLETDAAEPPGALPETGAGDRLNLEDSEGAPRTAPVQGIAIGGEELVRKAAEIDAGQVPALLPLRARQNLPAPRKRADGVRAHRALHEQVLLGQAEGVAGPPGLQPEALIHYSVRIRGRPEGPNPAPDH